MCRRKRKFFEFRKQLSLFSVYSFIPTIGLIFSLYTLLYAWNNYEFIFYSDITMLKQRVILLQCICVYIYMYLHVVSHSHTLSHRNPTTFERVLEIISISSTLPTFISDHQNAGQSVKFEFNRTQIELCVRRLNLGNFFHLHCWP